MIKLPKKYTWLLVMAVQSFLGIVLGLALVSTIAVNAVTGNVLVGRLNIGGMTFDEASKAVTEYYDRVALEEALVIELGENTFRLNYSEFDARVDTEKTIEILKKEVPWNGFDKLFYNSKKDIVIKPPFSYNSGKLSAYLEKILSPLEKLPAKESYKVDGDALVYTPPVPGIMVDYEAVINELENYMFTGEPFRIDAEKAAFLVEEPGESLYKEPFSKIISKAQVEFDLSLMEKVLDALNTINGSVFEAGQDINLSNLLDFSKFSGDIERDLLNRISTGVFQAAVKIEGIKIINHRPSTHPVSYADAGLEAVIAGIDGNLVLKNEANGPLMLLADISENKMNFYFVSTVDIKSGILIIQKKDEVPPPVITSVNNKLGKGESRVVSEGTPGFTAIVSRIIDDERQELFSNKYEPVSKVVETSERPVLAGDK